MRKRGFEARKGLSFCRIFFNANSKEGGVIMTALEALDKMEAKMRTVISNKREEYDWEKETFKNADRDDPYREYHYQQMRRAFHEIQMLNMALIWINDIKEECEEEEP